MNRRDFIRAGALIGVAMLPTQSWAQTPDTGPQNDPRAIVEAIYKISAGKDGKYSGNSAFFQPAVRKRWFSPSLIKALAAADRVSKRTNEPVIDFDPVTNSQDPDVKNLTITVESDALTKSVVLAKFTSFDEKEPSRVRYIFVRVDKAWKLDDMTGEHAGADQWTLRDLLK